MICYGYVRVSSQDQNEDRQMIAMQECSVEKDKITTAEAQRRCGMTESTFYRRRREKKLIAGTGKGK